VEKIIKAFAQPFDGMGERLRVTCSVGVRLYPDNGSDVSVPTKMADALCKAKEAGKNTYWLATD
jgi:two-component system CheB/CheR fusion protein